MNFIERILGWIFGKKKDQLVRLEKTQALDYVEKHVFSGSKELEKTVFSKLAELKHLLKELEESSKQIRSKNVAIDEGNFRLRRAVVSSKETLSIHFSSLAGRLEPPKTFDLLQVYDYVVVSRPLVAREVVNSRKNIAYTKEIMADEVKQLGGTVSEIDRLFADMQDIYQKSSFLKFAEFKKRFADLDVLLSEKTVLSKEFSDNVAEINSLSLKRKKLSFDLEELRGSSFASDLARLEEKKKALFDEKNALKQKFLLLLEKIDKPLSRFIQFASNDTSILSAEERELASHYFQNIFIASKRDPKAVTLKKILSRLLELVENGTIGLKEKEKEKKVAAIKELLEYDFFSELFWKLNSLEAELSTIDKQISEDQLSSKILALEKEISRVSMQATLKQSENQKIFQKQEQREKEFQAARLGVQDAASSITGQKIVLEFA